MENWAVDMKDVAAIYPMQGYEWLLVVLLFAIWIGWHVWQFGYQKKRYAEEVARYGHADEIGRVMDERASRPR